ncbi:MAG TPA: TonB family protein [Candidatus Acidoferrales bacterium]|jgi:TonB family protein|nr:TonB family protein [Candidatus Acidoferrales bacterium]
MPGAFEHIQELAGPDRRTYSRQPVRTITYVELDEGNGGIVLNASEGGLSVQAVMGLMEESLPKMRFRLSQSKGWLETAARVAWANESRKVAGLQFVDMPEEARLQIREWLALEAAERESSNDAPAMSEREIPGVATEPERAADLTESVAAPPPIPMPLPLPTPALRIFSQTPALPTDDFGVAPAPPDEDADRSERAWNIAGLIAILAIVSLAAGWIAGRGTFNSLWSNLRTMASSSKAAPSPVTVTPNVSVPISQIETVDVHNQQWTIPFDASGNNQSTLRGQASSQPAPHTPWPASDPALAIPEVQSHDGDDSNSQHPSAPAVSEPSSNVASIPVPSQSPDPRDIVPPPQPVSQTAPAPTNLQRGALIYHVSPVYPEIAKDQGIDGTVRLEVTIGTNGLVRSVIALSGPGLLIEAARGAVRQWRYTPSLLNGKPIESTVYVSVVFRLPSSR